MNQQDSKKYIKILVTELFPRLCKQRILLTHKEIQPSVKSTDGKQYISIPHHLFEQYLLLGQQYHIEHRDWIELTHFTNSMLDCCGYTRLGQIGFQSHVNKFQYMQEKRSQIRIDATSTTTEEGGENDDLAVSVAFMCEFKAIAVQFIQFCNEYYRAVCTLDVNGDEEKSCLIPICAIKPAITNNTSDRRDFTDTTTAIQPQDYYQTFAGSSSSTIEEEGAEEEDYSHQMNSNNKRGRSLSCSSFSNNSSTRRSSTDILFAAGYANDKRQRLEVPDRGGEGLNSYCMSGVDSALQILSKAADCMRHIVELWDWALQMAPGVQWIEIYGGWEQG